MPEAETHIVHRLYNSDADARQASYAIKQEQIDVKKRIDLLFGDKSKNDNELDNDD